MKNKENYSSLLMGHDYCYIRKLPGKKFRLTADGFSKKRNKTFKSLEDCINFLSNNYTPHFKLAPARNFEEYQFDGDFWIWYDKE